MQLRPSLDHDPALKNERTKSWEAYMKLRAIQIKDAKALGSNAASPSGLPPRGLNGGALSDIVERDSEYSLRSIIAVSEVSDGSKQSGRSKRSGASSRSNRSRRSIRRSNESLSSTSAVGLPVTTSTTGDDIAEIDIHQIEIQRMIGQGKYSEVFLGSLEGEPVAVKVVHNYDCWREVVLLGKVRHENVIRMFHAALMDNSTHIVMEICTGGSLFHMMHERTSSLGRVGPSWPQRMRICTDVASAMEYLHGLKTQIIHRDLKSLNLLLKREVTNHDDLPQVKVADLGLSRTLKKRQGTLDSGKEEPSVPSISGESQTSIRDRGAAASKYSEDSRMTMDVGTLQWMAPEVHMSESYDEKVDVYSFAMVLYEVAWQRIPFNEEDKCFTFSVERVILGARPNISQLPPGCPEELPALIKVCWARTAAGRPSFSKVTPWLKAVAAEKGYNKWTVAL
mmetsp:Transcript_13574/g.40454  ORF Transcript_13574/g.40454 Transcript_13574/m.40454 type:complete len:452 (+) Transcript_13574:157-1512(+)